MWNIFFVGLLLGASCLADVSHLKHGGYPSDKPDHPLELPGEGSTNTASVGYPKVVPENPLPLPEASNGDSSVSGYPKVVPENRLKIPEASSGNVKTQVPDATGEGSSSGGVIAIQQRTKSDQKHDHYHGEDGKYDHHDDGRGWDIRKSVPGEPGQDYPTYDSVPSTSFTCKEKAPGYYADEEARCQVFRVCTTNSLKTYNSFLCPNGSLFNQRVLTCDWWMNVDCTSSSDFYYKNQEIGKMPTGQQLMYEVSKMLEAPNNNPYQFNRQQQQFLDQTLQDNQIQGTGAIQDVYLPVKQPVITTTKAYYTPTIPTTTTTTTTTTQKPIIMTNLNRVDTNKNTFTQQTFQNVNVKQQEDELKQSTVQDVENKYIPPPVQKVEQTSLSNVKNQQNKIQIDQSSTSGLSGYDYQKQVPSVVTTQQVTNQNQEPQPNPSVTVTKEQTHTVTHSQKTTHVFQNVDEGPEKISLIQNTQNSGVPVPSISTGSLVQNQQKDQNLGVQQQGISFVQTQQKAIPSGFDITKEQAFQQIDNIQSGLQQINQQQETNQKFGAGVLNPRKNPQNIPVPDFGQNLVFAGAPFQNIPQGFSHQGVQPNIYPEPNYPVDAYLQNQGGYQYQPNFHEQNLQNYNFHGQNAGQNFNIDVNRDGSAQNYKGESLTQHTNGQTHSTYSGHNVAFKESTKVDIVPSLGFHLNDDYEKNSYISAVLGGLIHDGPAYQPTGPDNFGQGQFLPHDVRFSSYQGPSSYIVPQGSVQRLPSDSGYYR